MTTYILSLRTLGGDEARPDPALTTLADLRTTDPAVIGATLRAVADRLDPPQPVRPVYRDMPPTPERAALRASRATGNAYDAQCRGNDCAEGHTYLTGCALEPPSMRGRLAAPAQIDAMVCPDCTDDEHTYEPGRCALAPGDTFAQQVTKRPHGAWACQMGGQPHAGTCDHPTPLMVDDPGDRMDAPDAVLSPAAAEVVARVKADHEAARVAERYRGGVDSTMGLDDGKAPGTTPYSG